MPLDPAIAHQKPPTPTDFRSFIEKMKSKHEFLLSEERPAREVRGFRGLKRHDHLVPLRLP